MDCSLVWGSDGSRDGSGNGGSDEVRTDMLVMSVITRVEGMVVG